MDPLSITTACLTLVGTVGKTSLAVTTFIRGCREARSDLTSISGELTQLHLVLDLLKDDAAVSDGRVIPESLQVQILSIIKNCSAVVDSINTVLENHSGKAGAVKWVAFGKAEVAGLRMSLEAHRGSLSLVLELVSVSLSRAILDDVAVVRTDVHDIKQDTSQIPEIMAELTRLRAIVSGGEIPPTTRGQNFVLEQYLDSLTSYAETVCNDVVWDSDSLRTLSRKPSLEHVNPGASDIELALSDESANPPESDTKDVEAMAESLVPNVPDPSSGSAASDRLVGVLAYGDPTTSQPKLRAAYFPDKPTSVYPPNWGDLERDATGGIHVKSEITVSYSPRPSQELDQEQEQEQQKPQDKDKGQHQSMRYSSLYGEYDPVPGDIQFHPSPKADPTGNGAHFKRRSVANALTQHTPTTSLSGVMSSVSQRDFGSETSSPSELTEGVARDAPIATQSTVDPKVMNSGTRSALITRKLVITGDGAVGKSTLFM